MRDIGVLPRLDELFALGFLGTNASTAYTAAGSFVGFVRERFGAAVVGRWYGGGDLAELTRQSFDALEHEWHGWLDEISIGEAAIAQARARFDRPSVFARRCPHRVDDLLASAGGAEARGDLRGALSDYADALGLDPSHDRATIARAGCFDGLGETGRAIELLEAMVGADLFTRAGRDRALERLADLALRRGDCAQALPLYAEVRSRVLDEDRLRNLDVKELACADPLARPALVALLVGSDHRGPLEIEAIEQLAGWRAVDPADGLPDYLLARRYLDAGRYDRAAELLRAALVKDLWLPRVRAEARRLELVVRCALGEQAGARDAFAAYEAEREVAPTRIEWARGLMRRCTR
jgi:tetratricopeptide (TPR) repeat protein